MRLEDAKIPETMLAVYHAGGGLSAGKNESMSGVLLETAAHAFIEWALWKQAHLREGRSSSGEPKGVL